MNQPLNRPDFFPLAVVFPLANLRLRAFQHALYRLAGSFQRKPKGGGISSAKRELTGRKRRARAVVRARIAA
jgi:hypothetical protein